MLATKVFGKMHDGLELTDDEAAAVEKPYTSHEPSWY